MYNSLKMLSTANTCGNIHKRLLLKVCLVYCYLSMGLVYSYELSNTKLEGLPLKEDRKIQSFSHSVGCQFGGTRYDIDSQWHPILEPYGVMYCLKCSCEAVIKKGLLQQRGQVQCRRISQECPDISSCQQTPVLPPNSCCKVCPHNEEDRLISPVSPVGRQARHDPPATNNYKIEHQASAASAININSNSLSNSGTATEFSVLLSRTTNSTVNVVGKSFLTLDQSGLRITIELSSVISNLTKIQLKSKSGDIIFETDRVNITEIHGNTMKICLAWRDVSNHADDIKSDLVQLILATREHPHGVLSGYVKTITPQVLETFSSLLLDTSNAGYAATLSMGVVLSSGALTVRGSVTAPSAVLHGKHPVIVQILRERRLLFTEEQIVAISNYGGEFTMRWTSLSTASLKQLARGRLTARLVLPNDTIISGSINTFYRCGGLTALVTGQDAVPKYATMGVASAKFNLTHNGHISYQIEIKDVESRITEVVIETDRSVLSGTTKITRLAKDINDAIVVKISGVYDKTDARELQLLLEGKLFINIQTRLRPASALRGQILLVPSTQPEHTLMVDRDTGMAALAWCGGSDCTLTCSLLVPRVSVRRDSSTQAYLRYWNQKQLLATFTESNLMEVTVTKSEVQQIASTLPTINIVTKDTTLYGQVSIPDKCFEDSTGHLLPSADQERGPRGEMVDTPLHLAQKCSYDMKIYSDGESWKPKDSNLACVTCSCKRNKAQCHPVICPAVECATPVTLPGECCPACPKATDNTTKTCFFPGDHRQHAVGTVWHPFMHPGGYFKCAVCYCKSDGETYDCKPTSCPVLSCPEHLQETLPGECCPTCKDPANVATLTRSNTDLSRMQGDSDSYSSCKIGDKQYANGESFNPQIGQLGMYGNVLCICNNGKLDCNPIECDCNKKIARKNRCCMRQCGFTESDMIRKKRRKDKNKARDLIC